jgi:hypothetical protein
VSAGSSRLLENGCVTAADAWPLDGHKTHPRRCMQLGAEGVSRNVAHGFPKQHPCPGPKRCMQSAHEPVGIRHLVHHRVGQRKIGGPPDILQLLGHLER